MEIRPPRAVTGCGLPDLLTVEEAADILRVGRTKAYRMAAEWRSTAGQAGLPVLDFGNVLRVPRHALEQLVGAELHVPADLRAIDTDEQRDPDTDAAPKRRQRPSRRPKSDSASQLDLFDPPPAS